MLLLNKKKKRKRKGERKRKKKEKENEKKYQNKMIMMKYYMNNFKNIEPTIFFQYKKFNQIIT